MEQSEGNGAASLDKDKCTFENCSEQVINYCRTCGARYCLDHASEVDPEHYCSNCLVPEDASVVVEPLIDAEGVPHKGRLIKPAGKAYRLSAKMVFDMQDKELEDFIEHEKHVVRDIENIREYHLATLGLAESEAYRREISEIAKVGGILRFGTSTQRVPAIRHKKALEAKRASTKANKVDDVVANLKALGIKPEELAKLIMALPSKKR